MYGSTGRGEGEAVAEEVAQRCVGFLAPLLEGLDRAIDARLVRTLGASVVAVVRHRSRSVALLLSELGGYLTGPEHAPAGTKRLANLIHSSKWRAEVVEDYLLEQGREQVEREAGKAPEGKVLCILDGSVAEKAESAVLEGLCPVRSSKARRLSRPRPKLGKGYYHGPPSGPIVVPGFKWTNILLAPWTCHYQRPPLTLGAWHWYAKPFPPDPITGEVPVVVEEDVPRQKDWEAQKEVLERVVGELGKDRLLHVWDRGMSGAGWLGEALDAKWQFVVRWKKGNHLRPSSAPSVGNPYASNAQRERDGVAAWRLTAGLKLWGRREVSSPRNPKQPMQVSFAARPVRLLYREDPLWLVLARRGKGQRRRGGQEPWRLLTNLPVQTEAQCWRIVEAYMARWQVEQSLRYGKSELGVESVRVRRWEHRHKLLALVSLAYAFLLHLLGDSSSSLLTAVLRFAHRTGRQAQAWRPLYRLRAALAHLWHNYTPNLQGFP